MLVRAATDFLGRIGMEGGSQGLDLVNGGKGKREDFTDARRIDLYIYTP